ncbi:flavin reductase family protein [Alteribacillus sp. YIM 98480]|uniref:flavin reductase family protein n=1 Tax=Alteribacillus sp. YIM 98480 TaxID=2606599 RepID=UPI00131E1694|nr:flavin reductase family protein [Alteribacillus sp. YIM 98480]
MQTQEKETLFKEAMGNYPTGVTVVTSSNEKGEPVGLTVNSFASVSIDPLLVLWSIDHKVSSLDAFKQADGFAVHILAGEQQELCKTFASKDTDRFGTCEWSISEHNLPVISDAFAVLECKTFKQVEAGDHTILIGEVQNIQIDKEKDPMLYHRRCFGPIPAEFYGK